MSVIILFGGASSERLVSVASAQNISRALPDAEPWFITPAGAVHRLDAAALQAHQEPFEQPLNAPGAPLFSSLTHALDSAAARGLTFLLAFHGGDGENGTVQALFEARRLPFTASGSRASRAAFDKVEAKALVGARGARLARAEVLPPMTRAAAQEKLKGLLDARPRWVLKPVADGSSAGLVHLTGPELVAKGAETLAALQVRYLAEEFIEGRELTVGVVDDERGPTALPVSEVRFAAGAAFDYAGKYLGKGTEELTPARLSDADRAQAQALGVLAHTALGCEGYSRTDMILTASGPVFLETNTLPGLTRASFIPQQLAAAGRALSAFLERQLTLARARAERAPAGR